MALESDRFGGAMMLADRLDVDCATASDSAVCSPTTGKLMFHTLGPVKATDHVHGEIISELS